MADNVVMVANYKILVLGDTHFPFEHKPTIKAAIKFAKIHKPTHIIQIGDLADMFSEASFDRSYDIITPKEEFRLFRLKARFMWEKLQKASPNSKCFQLTGNHDSRPMRICRKKVPVLASLLEPAVQDVFTFPGVKSIYEQREELILKQIVFLHGHLTGIGKHLRFNLMNTVHGHTHKGGVQYLNRKEGIIWELDVGFMADRTQVPLKYTMQAKITKETLGFGFIDGYGPRFIPL